MKTIDITRRRVTLHAAVWLPLLLGNVGSVRAPEAPTPGQLAEAAVRSLAAHVPTSSSPDALAVTFEAYYRHQAEHESEALNPYLYFVDLGLDNLTPRGYVFDMERLDLVDGPFAVAHGSGSSATRNAVPSVFSNEAGSHASSLGLYRAEGLYPFHGRSGGRAYTSTGLRLRGESGAFNDAAIARGIVVHGAPYVTATTAGRSEGCPAMEPARAERLLPLLADGGTVFLYSPRNEDWLRAGPWVRPADQ